MQPLTSSAATSRDATGGEFNINLIYRINIFDVIMTSLPTPMAVAEEGLSAAFVCVDCLHVCLYTTLFHHYDMVAYN